MKPQFIPTHDSQALHGTQTHEELLRFRIAMDMCGDAIYLVDRAAMRFVDVNQTACARMGYSREELLHMGPQDLLTASRGEIERLYDEAIAAGVNGTTTESTARAKDGHATVTELHRRALRMDDGWIIVSIARDITGRKQMERELLASEKRFRLTFEFAGSGIAHVDLAGRFRRINRSLSEILGYSSEELVGRRVKDFSHPEDRDRTDAERARLHSGELESIRVQKRYLRKDGAIVWVNLTFALMRDAEGTPLYEIVVFNDVTERKLMEERVQHVAHHDSLTGLPNRLLFNDRLSQSISLAKRDTRQFALLYLDLDRFKPVNDALGHSAGDELLKAVATRIQREVRESDTLARVGGDEFVVILHAIGGREQAQAVARKITAALATPFQLGVRQQCVDVGISIGVALYPADARDADSLVNAADAAMYRDKQAKEKVASV